MDSFTGIGRARLFFLFVLALIVFALVQGSRSHFIQATLPFFGKEGNPSYGYSYYYDGDLLHKENFYPLKLIDRLKEGRPGRAGATLEFTDSRLLYSFLGNLLTVLFDAHFAFQVLNFILLLGTLFLMIHIANRVIRDPVVTFLTGMLYLLSLPVIFFAGDYSTHLLSVFLYACWIALLLAYTDDLLTPRQLFGLHLFVALWAQAYSSVYFAVLSFLPVALRKRRWLHTVSVPVAVLLSLKAQSFITTSFGVSFARSKVNAALEKSLANQLVFLADSPIEATLIFMRELVNYIIIDNPLLCIIGLFALVTYRGPYRWTLTSLAVAPVALSFPFFMTASARGYLTAPYLLVLLPLVAALIVYKPGGSFSFKHPVALSGIFCAIIISSQLFWSFGSRFGFYFPAHTAMYGLILNDGKYYGLQHASGSFFSRTDILSMTGNMDDVPGSLGGSLSWASYVQPDGGNSLQIFPTTRKIFPSTYVDFMGCLSSVYFQLLLLLLFATIPLFIFPGVAAGAGTTLFVMLLFFASLFWGADKGFYPHRASYLDLNMKLRGSQKLIGSLQLSQDFVSSLHAFSEKNPEASVDLYVKSAKLASGEFDIRFFGEEFSPIYNRKYLKKNIHFPEYLTLSLKSFLMHISQEQRAMPFEIKLTGGPEATLYIGSWRKRVANENSRIARINGKETDWFPAIEIRVRRSAGSAYALIGL